MKKLLEKLPKLKVSPAVYKKLPETAGIYVFFKKSVPIYIGKAINLKHRVSSYFDLDLEPKTGRMVRNADCLSFIKVTGELEALLLEAKLIRTYMPQYNIIAKDDKHPLYIAITKEKYPRVISVRKLIASGYLLKASYGPFPSSRNVRSVLKMLRRVINYSDHKLGKKPCLYSQIGLCNPCPSQIEMTNDKLQMTNLRGQYLRNIRNLKSILDGKIEKVQKNLEKEMAFYSDSNDFENAAIIRDQIKRLEYITKPQIPTESFLKNPNLYEDIRKKELKDLAQIIGKIPRLQYKSTPGVEELKRIECFDIAHLAATFPAASMVTFINGEAEKKFYRHFRVRQKKGNSDVDSLKEVIKRRLNHINDWGKPDLIIVDGGKPQAGIFFWELTKVKIPVIGIAKRFETLVFPIKIDGTLTFKEYKLPKGPALNLVARMRDEAHRFARRYHHKLISKSIILKK